ncbi:MAG: hypothetical protein Q4D02_01995 [Clostridia bacterium]|nr:hypothetical protein [Clostridia bacterium]
MGKGRGTVFTRIQKVKRKDNKILEECHICKNCTDRNICNNRNDCNKCDKCKKCKDHNDCDKFYFYTRIVGEYRSANNKVGKTIYGKKKSDVNKEVTLKIAEVHKGIHVDSSKITLKELMQTVVNNRFLNGQTKERAYARNLDTIKAASKIEILNMCIQDISHNDIIESLSAIRQYSQSVIDKIFGLINSAFKLAVINKLLYTNPFENKDVIKKPRSKLAAKIVRSFTIEEQKLFVKRTFLEEKYGIMFRIDMATGLRPR